MTDAQPDNPPRFRPDRHHVALGVILVLALGLRVWGIGAQSLWHDEVLTTLSASVPFLKVVDSVESNENKPPLYFFVMNLWARAAGMSEAALRLPSAFFGIAAVGVIYLLGRDLFDDRRVGLIAALLLTFSRYHIGYSQEARTYSLMFLLMLLACWFGVRIIKRTVLSDQIGYVAAATLAMYAHPFAAFALAAVNAFYFATFLLGPRPATELRRWIILQFAFTLGFSPWLWNTWDVATTGLPWIINSTPVPAAMLSYAGSAPLLALLVALLAVALGYGLVRRERGILLLVLLIVCATLGPLMFQSKYSQTFIPRYGIVAVGGLLLLGAYGAARLRPWAGVLVCIAFVAASMAHFRPGYGNYPGAEPKADVRSAARYVRSATMGGDAVMNPTRYLLSRPIDHYFAGSGIANLGHSSTPPDPQRYPSLWVFYGDPEGYGAIKPPPGYQSVDRQSFDGIVLYHFAAPLTSNQ
jgi:4-amino-4-deoxy-L-arabinose transferase-like glycosyltransferase